MLSMYFIFVFIFSLKSADAEMKLKFSSRINENGYGNCFKVIGHIKPQIQTRMSHIAQTLYRFVDPRKLNIDIRVIITCRGFFLTPRDGYLIWKTDFMITGKEKKIIKFLMPYFIFIGSNKFYEQVSKKTSVKKFDEREVVENLGKFYSYIDNWIITYAKSRIDVSKAILSTFHINIGPMVKFDAIVDSSSSFLGGGLTFNLNIGRLRLGLDFMVGASIDLVKGVEIDSSLYLGFMLTEYNPQSMSVYAEIGWNFQRKQLRSASISLEDVNGIVVAFDLSVRLGKKKNIGLNVKPFIKLSRYSRGQFVSLTAFSIGISLAVAFRLIN